MPDLLIEIGCEELPAVACREAERQVPGLLADGLDRLGLDANTRGCACRPRRIAAIATGLPERAGRRARRGARARGRRARAGAGRVCAQARLEVGDAGGARRAVWAISDGAATPAAELVPELVGGSVAGAPLLASRCAGTAAASLGPSAGSWSSSTMRWCRWSCSALIATGRVARPAFLARPGARSESPPSYRERYARAHVMVDGGGAAAADRAGAERRRRSGSTRCASWTRSCTWPSGRRC